VRVGRAQYDFNYDRNKNLRPKRNIRTAMNHEVMMYAIAQKEQMGFDKCVEECSAPTPAPPPAVAPCAAAQRPMPIHPSRRAAEYRMSRYGVKPNMLILPPQMLLYMALAPEAKLTYKEGGPAAEARFEAGVEGMEARAFRDCGIFTSEPFEVSDDSDSVQLLTRNSQVGEFYVLQPPQVKPDDNKEKHTCDVLLYDEESDRHVRITWMDALRASGAHELAKADASTSVEGGETIGEWFLAALKWGAYSMGYTKGVQCTTAGVISEPAAAVTTDAVAFGATIAIKPASFTYAECSKGDGLNKRIVIARPFIEHLMHSAILTVSGRDTGATRAILPPTPMRDLPLTLAVCLRAVFGPADMQLSANTQVKTIEGHYTGHFKAVITKPQRAPPPLPTLSTLALTFPPRGRRHGDARRRVLRLRRRLQHRLLRRGRDGRHLFAGECLQEHDEAPLV